MVVPQLKVNARAAEPKFSELANHKPRKDQSRGHFRWPLLILEKHSSASSDIRYRHFAVRLNIMDNCIISGVSQAGFASLPCEVIGHWGENLEQIPCMVYPSLSQRGKSR